VRFCMCESCRPTEVERQDRIRLGSHPLPITQSAFVSSFKQPLAGFSTAGLCMAWGLDGCVAGPREPRLVRNSFDTREARGSTRSLQRHAEYRHADLSLKPACKVDRKPPSIIATVAQHYTQAVLSNKLRYRAQVPPLAPVSATPSAHIPITDAISHISFIQLLLVTYLLIIWHPFHNTTPQETRAIFVPGCSSRLDTYKRLITLPFQPHHHLKLTEHKG
jgi:hypothetical protein